MKPRPGLWMGLLIAARLSASQTDYGSGGSATWTLLQGTRALAVGPAAALMADDAGLMGQEPGGLAWLKGGELGLHHGLWQAGESWDQVNLRQPLDGATQMGLAAGLTSFEPMDRTDASGQPLGTYNASEALLGGALARRLDAFGLGFSGLLTRQTIDQSVAIGYAWSAGSEWRPSDWLGLALCFRTATEGLAAPAWSFDGGARLGPGDWRAVVDAHVEGEAPKRLQVAGSRRFHAGDWDLELLGGWGLDVPDPDLGPGGGWTVGLTVQWKAWSLDYAFVPLGDIEPQHHLGLRYAFAAPVAASAPAPKPFPVPPPVNVPAEPPMAALPQPQAAPSPSAAPAPIPPAGTEVLVLSESVEAGEALEQQGRLMEALAAYHQAVVVDPGDLVGWRHLAQVYGRLHRPDYARTSWEQVLRLAPYDPQAKQALQLP